MLVTVVAETRPLESVLRLVNVTVLVVLPADPVALVTDEEIEFTALSTELETDARAEEISPVPDAWDVIEAIADEASPVTEAIAEPTPPVTESTRDPGRPVAESTIPPTREVSSPIWACDNIRGHTQIVVES